MLALLALACAPDAVPGAGPLAAVVSPVGTYAADPAASSAEVETVTPYACAEDINVPQTGYSTDPPTLADAHADVLGAAPTPFHTHLQWAGDPSSTAAFVWRTDSDTYLTQVQIGLDTGYGITLDGRSFALSTTVEDGRVHEVRVCGLTPGTTWHYRVGGEGAWSADYTFTTAPPPGSEEPFVFGVAGDTRGGMDTWAQVLAGMQSHGVELRLFTGDAVVMGSRVSEWDDWYETGVGYMESVPTMMSHGNHEGLAQAHFALVALPGNEEWYSFDYGNVHFVAVNDSVASSADWTTQATWLAEDLAGTARPWKVMFHHKPAYTSSSHGEDHNVQTYFVPVEEAGGVQLDLAGHNHNYERSVPLAGGVEVAQADGTTYVVTAGGGAPLYDNDGEQPYTAVYAVTEHYMIGVVEGDTITMTSYDLAGNVLDTFTLEP